MTAPTVDRDAIDAFILGAKGGVAHVPVALLEALRDLMPDDSLAGMLANAVHLPASDHGAPAPGKGAHGAQRRRMRVVAPDYVNAVLAGGCPRQLRRELDLPTASDDTAFSNALREHVVERAEMLADLIYEVGDRAEPWLLERILTMAARLDAIEINKRGRPGLKSRQAAAIEAFQNRLNAQFGQPRI